jgi:mono/diheme cytochrome c family protein
MKTLGILIGLTVGSMIGAGFYFYSGRYPVGADVPHNGWVLRVLQEIRERSIAAKASDVPVPVDLDDPKRLSNGAGHYASMCSVCHLAPGFAQDETAEGLYPRPPPLAQGISLTPAQIFWVIKHGLKMTGMPAWGPSHSDEELWDLTAFVIHLPKMSTDQYRSIVTQAPMDEDMQMMPMPGAATGRAGR